MYCSSNSISYYNKDTIQIIFNFNDEEVKDFQNAENINIHIFKANEKRNTNWATFSPINTRINENKLIFEYKLQGNYQYGLYFVKALTLRYQNGTKKDYLVKEHFNNLFMYLSTSLENPLNEQQLNTKIDNLERSRIEYNNKAIGVKGATTSNNFFNIFIFVVGCKIFHKIEMGHYNIYPLNYGFKYNHMNDAVNTFFQQIGIDQLQIDPEITRSFDLSTPLFVINFKAIYAFNVEEAIAFCKSQSEQIMNILAYEQTHKPNYFASIAVDKDKKIVHKSFDFPGYYGNLASPFSISHLADKIDDLLPKINQHPLIDLIIRNYTDALNEKNIFFEYFKFWSILETLAENIVPNNQNIYYANGNKIKRKNQSGILEDVKTKNALAKVYWLVYNSNLSTSYITIENFTTVIEMNKVADTSSINCSYQIISLWNFLRGFYKLRNSVAHRGVFDISSANITKEDEKYASQIIGIHYPHKYDFSGFIKSIIDTNIDKIT